MSEGVRGSCWNVEREAAAAAWLDGCKGLLLVTTGSSSAKGLVCRVGGVTKSSSKGFIVHLSS